MAGLKTSKIADFADLGIAFPPLTFHQTSKNLKNFLDVSEFALATILPADAKNAGYLDFDRTEEIAQTNVNNYKVHLQAKVT